MAGNKKPQRKKSKPKAGGERLGAGIPGMAVGVMRQHLASFHAEIDQHLERLEKDTALSPEEKEKTRQELIEMRNSMGGSNAGFSKLMEKKA